MNQVRDLGRKRPSAAHNKPFEPFERNIAVIIGINQYQNGIPILKTPVNDARRLAKILEDKYEYKKPYVLENANGNEIEQFLTKKLPALIGKKDRLLFYFAGHGVPLESEDGPQGYMVPADGNPTQAKTSYLAMQDVNRWLEAIQARHLLVILDCCFAGTFRWSGTRRVLQLPEIQKERYERYISGTAQQVLTSTGKNEEALDTFGKREAEGQQRHSPFAAALFRGLEDEEADLSIDGKKDGVITAGELSIYLNQVAGDTAKNKNDHQQTTHFWSLAQHESGQFVFETPNFDYDKLQPAPELNLTNNPYKGLNYYTEKDAELFFGRDNDIAQLHTLLTETTANSQVGQFIVVTGPSGSGKSSLVHAGLIPKLKNNPSDWSIVGPIQPGENPLVSLHQAFNQMEQADVSEQANKQILLIVDNLEELTANQNHMDQGSFSTLIKGEGASVKAEGSFFALMQDRLDEKRTDYQLSFFNELEKKRIAYQGRLHIVVTARNDFVDQFPFLQIDKNEDTAYRHHYLISPMTQDTLRAVIEKPAESKSVYFEPAELVETLINEVNQTPGALRLLSYALSEMYIAHTKAKRQDRALNQADYNKVGGVRGALGNNIKAVYDGLPDEYHRNTLRHILLRTVSPQGIRNTRRRVPRHEITYADEIKNRQVDKVLECLAEAGMLVEGDDIELAHDDLITAWPAFVEWQGEAVDYMPLQRRLTNTATTWDKEGDKSKKKGLLWNRNSQLPRLKEVHGSDDNWLNKLELAFVEQSMTKAKQDRQNLWWSIAFIFIVLSIIMLSARSSEKKALTAQQETIQQRNAAQVQAMLVQANNQYSKDFNPSRDVYDRALLMIKQGVAMTERDDLDISNQFLNQQVRQLMNELPTPQLALKHQDTVTTVAYSPDGKVLAAASWGIVSLWNVADLESPTMLSIPEGSSDVGINSLAYSPDGQLLAAASNNAVWVWDVADTSSITLLPMPEGSNAIVVNSVAFSHDSNSLAMASSGNIWLWDMNAPSLRPLPLFEEDIDDGEFTSVAFSPDGKSLAISIGSIGQLWDVGNLTEPKPLTSLEGHNGVVNHLAFSPDSQTLALASDDKTVSLWDITDPSSPNLLPKLEGHGSAVVSVAFSPDGQTLASSSWDKTVRLWDVTNLGSVTLQTTLKGHDGVVNSVVFSPDLDGKARFLASASRDTTVRLWDLEKLKLVAIYPILDKHDDLVLSVAFSPSNGLLASASNDKTIHLWNLTNPISPTLSAVLGDDNSAFSSVAFSPDGNILAAGSLGIIWLWDMTDINAAPQKLPVEDSDNWIWSIAFAPDLDGTTRIMAAPSGSTVWLWDVTNSSSAKSLPPLKGHDDFVFSAAFSPNSETLATASLDATVRLWDITNPGSPTLLGEPIDHEGSRVFSVAFSSNGKILASAYEKWVTLWDVTDLNSARFLSSLETHDDLVFSVAFSPDDKTLASATIEATIQLWDNSELIRLNFTDLDATDPITPTLFATLDGHTGSINSVVFAHDGLLVSGSDDGTIRLWPTIENLANVACQQTLRNFSWGEWQEFLPDHAYEKTCPNLPVHDSLCDADWPEAYLDERQEVCQ